MKHTEKTIKFEITVNDVCYFNIKVHDEPPTYAITPGMSEMYTKFNMLKTKLLAELNSDSVHVDEQYFIELVEKDFVIIGKANFADVITIAMKME